MQVDSLLKQTIIYLARDDLHPETNLSRFSCKEDLSLVLCWFYLPSCVDQSGTWGSQKSFRTWCPFSDENAV